MNDPRLTRWIHASVREYLETRKQTKSTIKMFCEADIRQTNKEKEHLELRIDGPYESGAGTAFDYSAIIEISILINTTYFEDQIFRHQNNMGLAAYMLDVNIPIYRTGDNKDDNGLIGTLTTTGNIISSNFGQIDNNVQVQQGTVEAHYTYQEC